MINVAIIVGVSNYKDSYNSLPGCKQDAEVMHNILLKTGKFSNILYINEDQGSAVTKELITNFISENKGKPIEELFFYFSGHGEFADNEFYYLLSDFDGKKRRQTSLQNTEVDDLLKALAPALVVKVIDACQSGTTYIKDSNVLAKYFTESQMGFKKCYFLSSSMNNQYSYQNQFLSHFTFSFARALRDHGAVDIRYKDIIDVIADDFSGNPDQTPFFVIQAEYTEKFCTLSKSLKEYLFTLKSGVADEEQKQLNRTSLLEVVKKDAADYVDKEGAIAGVKLVGEELLKLTLDGELSDLYELEVTFSEDYSKVWSLRAVGKWITDNKNEYFATPIYDEYWDEEAGDSIEYVSSIDLKVEVPYKAISIEFNGKYPNLVSYHSDIVFLLSKRHIRFFVNMTEYTSESWDTKTLNYSKYKWITREVKLASHGDINEGLKYIKDLFQNKIEKDLKEKYDLAEKSEDQSTNG